MDLVSAETKRGGTRGGRNDFNWDDVKKNDREFYLGNSVAGVSKRWERSEIEKPSEENKEVSQVRRQERAVLDAALGGTQSFAEAVRSALADSVDSSVDERGKVTTDDMDVERKSSTRAEKEKRKAVRRQRREERKRRREARQKRREERAARNEQGARAEPGHDSSESEHENYRDRMHEDNGRPRRRRKDRETGTKRKRAQPVSSSELDSDVARGRRTRFRSTY